MRPATVGRRLLLSCAFFCAACRGTSSRVCPKIDEFSANPAVIEDFQMPTEIVVRVSEGDDGDMGPLEILLTSDSGSFADPTASKTTFNCDRLAEGRVEICVGVGFAGDDVDDGIAGSGADSGVSEVAVSGRAASEIAIAEQYLRGPHGVIADLAACFVTRCIDVQCPENLCPLIEDFRLVETPVLSEATVFVTVSDPDERPQEVVTTLSATNGSFDDVNAAEATYTCEPFAPNPIEICVTASDGEGDCDQRQCGQVNCNLCPLLFSLSFIPSVIPPGEDSAEVEVRADDPDDFPGPLVTTLTATRGSFDDPNAMDTVYRCDGPGTVEICAEVDDQDCGKSSCGLVTCP